MRGRAMQHWLIAAACMAAACVPARVGATQIHLHGLLDVVAAELPPGDDLNMLTRGDSPFDAYGLRLFADAQVSEQFQIFTQVVLRDGSAIYVDGAYLTYTPQPALDLHVLAGKIPWAIGTWAPRTYSNKNPLVGTPLLYQYHTTLKWFAVPPDADGLLATAGSGQLDPPGMAIVDDSYWDVGITVTGSRRPLEYALGVTSGTPGWGSTSRDENPGKTFLGRFGIAPAAWLRLGISGAFGPYLMRELDPQLPPGRTSSDYHQRLTMADLEVQGGHLEIRLEGANGQWETPTVGRLDFRGGYVELKYAFSFGGYLAGRLEALRFGEIESASGSRGTWDSNVTRQELGAGIRFHRDVVGKLIHQYTRIEPGMAFPEPRRRSLIAAQLSVAF